MQSTNSSRIIIDIFILLDDYRFDVGNEYELVDDVDAQTLIKLVKFVKEVKPQALTLYTMRYLG